MMAARNGRRKATLAAVAIAGALLSVALFLMVGQATFRLGFPLDDAWIHQTYARNLAATGQWAFVPGQSSGGSTSPLWTILLAAGHRMGIDPRHWAYSLGAVALAASGVAAATWFRLRIDAPQNWTLLVGLMFVLEWHLVWSAASGMEVILMIGLAVAVMSLSQPPVHRPGALGLLVGIGIWIRPDAVSLGLIPATTFLVAPDWRGRQKLTALIRFAIGVSLAFVPYLLFNLRTAGSLWPSTFYAKQAEYAAHRTGPFVSRFLHLALDPQTGGPMNGTGILLLPGVIVAAVLAIRRRRWASLAPLLWALVYLALFAARLPVTYQHGRYQIPILPVVLVLGWEGIALAAERVREGPGRLLVRAWAVSAAAVTIAFVPLGARAYGQDVAVIETEMVDTARWISTHTEQEALIAAHDIGAVGYFGGRDILDLAGLADAEVIPILRDEAALADLLNRRGADYLMTFPGWYPMLTACAPQLHASQGRFAPALGGENMRVYRWPASPVAAPEGCMLYSPWPSGTSFAHERDLDPDRR